MPEPVGIGGVCGGRVIPSDKVRNFRNNYLTCGSGADLYRRSFVPFDYTAWENLEIAGDRDAMQAFRQKEPLIRWKGAVSFETIEHWDWTDCVLGQDPECGFHEECHDETVTKTDSDGKTYSDTEEVCITVMNTCYHDENESESRFCSDERMDYEAQFVRPTKKEWNPKSLNYYDIIPNKYDLLPGEMEVINVFSNARTDTKVKPTVEFGDPWNVYRTKLTILNNGHDQIYCKMNNPINLKVEIFTEARITEKNTPNTLRPPVDEAGKERSPIKFLNQIAKGGSLARVKPRAIELIDASYTMIASMARQSRLFDSTLENAKQENGLGETQTPEKYVSEKAKATRSGFFKDTQIRVQLYKMENWSRDVRYTHNLFTNGSVSSSMGFYDINLIGNGTKETDLYRASGPISDRYWEHISVDLPPDRNFELSVAMMQKGVPFYKQPKSENEIESCFSKDLPIPFSSSDQVDERNWTKRFNDRQGGR